jgi:hypothetical protein
MTTPSTIAGKIAININTTNVPAQQPVVPVVTTPPVAQPADVKPQ